MAAMKNRSPLRELFDEVTAANDWSQRDVEDRIALRFEGERGIGRSRVNQIINAMPLPSIKATAIRAIAAGLGISADRVAIAAVQSMGFRLASDDPSPAEAIRRDPSLSDETRRALLLILRASDEGRRGA